MLRLPILSGFLKCGRAIALPFLIFLFACNSSPPQPETKVIENIDHELHRIDAMKYAPAEYDKFRMNFRLLKDRIIQEESKFSWFRDYESAQNSHSDILREGERLLASIREKVNSKKEEAYSRIKGLEERAKIIDELTLKVNAGIYTRKKLTMGGISISEAKMSLKSNEYDSAMGKIDNASVLLNEAEKSIASIIKRYSQSDLINKWKDFVRDTIVESKKKGIAAIIVNKAERTLTMYKGGKAVLNFNIGIGRNGYRDKLFSGDGATPEGRYRIIKKSGIGKSKYYKALLLDYPNQDDRKEFLKAKRKGLISNKARIGGLIEIHGGGEDGTTYGCIALENHHMDELFERVAVGTPVTIVGATNIENELSQGLKGLQNGY